LGIRQYTSLNVIGNTEGTECGIYVSKEHKKKKNHAAFSIHVNVVLNVFCTMLSFYSYGEYDGWFEVKTVSTSM
jgi:hypothetical protein